MEGRDCANKCSLQSCSDREAAELLRAVHRPKSELVVSVNLKKIRVSNKLQPQELLSRGNQKVNILLVSYSSIK